MVCPKSIRTGFIFEGQLWHYLGFRLQGNLLSHPLAAVRLTVADTEP